MQSFKLSMHFPAAMIYIKAMSGYSNSRYYWESIKKFQLSTDYQNIDFYVMQNIFVNLLKPEWFDLKFCKIFRVEFIIFTSTKKNLSLTTLRPKYSLQQWECLKRQEGVCNSITCPDDIQWMKKPNLTRENSCEPCWKHTIHNVL